MKNEIWKWFDDELKVHCENNQDYRRIMDWKGTRHGSTYLFPDGSVQYDVIIPRRLHNRAARLLGLPNRVKTCLQVGKPSLQVVVGQ